MQQFKLVFLLFVLSVSKIFPIKLLAMGEKEPSIMYALNASESMDHWGVLQSSCPSLNLSSIDESNSFSQSCGVARLPLSYNSELGKSMNVGFSVINKKGYTGTSKPPLVIAQGGPGFSSMELAFDYVKKQPKLLDYFTLIAVDIRGSFYSNPYPKCEVTEESLKKIKMHHFEDLFSESSVLTQVIDDCAKKHVKSGLLPNLNSFEAANDIVNVVSYLGYSKFSFLGVSYGTIIGQYLLKFHNEKLLNIVLDSPAAPVVDWRKDAVVGVGQVLEDKIDLFVKSNLSEEFDVDSKEEFFDLAKRHAEQFKKEPELVTYDGLKIEFNEILYVNGLFVSILTYPIERISYYLKEASTRNDSSIETFLREMDREMDISRTVLYNAIICPEFDRMKKLSMPQDVVEFIAKILGDTSFLVDRAEAIDECGFAKHIKRNAPILLSPVKTEKEVMLVGGTLDYVSKTENIESVSVNMPNAIKYVFENHGHGVFAESDCASDTIISYLAGYSKNNKCE